MLSAEDMAMAAIESRREGNFAGSSLYQEELIMAVGVNEARELIAQAEDSITAPLSF